MTESSLFPSKDKIYNAYSLLNVIPGDSAEKIKETYRMLVGKFHPDQFSSNPEAHARATEKMKAINEAYSLIKHAPLSRADRLTTGMGDTQPVRETRKNPFMALFRKSNPGPGIEKRAVFFFFCFLNGCGLGVFFGIIFSLVVLVPLNIVYNYVATGTANLTVLPVNIIVTVISALFFGLYNGIAKTIFSFLDSR